MHATSSTNGVWSKCRATLHSWITHHRIPLAAISSCGAVMVTDGSVNSGLFVCFSAIALIFRQGLRFFFLVTMLCLSCGLLHLYRGYLYQQNTTKISVGSLQTMTVRVINISPQMTNTWQATARIIRADVADLIDEKIYLRGRGPAPLLGQAVTASGRMSDLIGPRNEGQMDFAAWQRRQQILGQFSCQHWQPESEMNHMLWEATRSLRDAFRDSITVGLENDQPAAKVIRAMVIGEQPANQDPLLLSFRNSGTLHLFSVSGQHVNIVALILWWFLQRLRISRRLSILLLIPAIFVYAWITGASAPAMRAAWMATVFLSAFLFQRRPDIMNALGVVMIAALLVDGNALFLAGVQLSYGVVAAIAFGLAVTRKYIQRASLFDDYLPRELYRNWQISASSKWHALLQSLSISTTASIGSAPLTIFHFGMVTPISIIANLALTFFVAALLAIAIVSSTLYMFSPKVASWSNRANAMVAHGCINISSFFANIPGGHFPLSMRNEKHDVIRIFDLPRGGGACIIHTQNADQLLDTGNENQFRTAVLPCIRAFGYEPDTMIMSHAESAHIGGAALAVEQLPVKQIIASVAESRATTFQQMQHRASQMSVPIFIARAQATIALDQDVKWEILSTADPREKNAMSDERVILYRLHFHGYRILFLNDASQYTIEGWLKTSPDPLCDIIVVGRHSYELPLNENTIALIKPRAIIATHSDFPENEAIPPYWEKQLEERGVALFHQGRTGMVKIHHEPDGILQIDGFLNQQKLVLPVPVK